MLHKFNLRQSPAIAPTTISLSITWPAGSANPLIVDLDDADEFQIRDAADLAAGFVLWFCGVEVDPVKFEESMPFNLGTRNGRRARRDNEAL